MVSPSVVCAEEEEAEKTKRRKAGKEVSKFADSGAAPAGAVAGEGRGAALAEGKGTRGVGVFGGGVGGGVR